MASWIGPALSAGASLIGSIFGGKKKETTTTHVDYARMVRDSEAAGFNPLTAIRNGGSAGFSSTTTTSSAPLSSRIADGVSGAMGQLAQDESFLAKFDPHVDNMREARYSLINAQVANLEANTKASMQTASNYERRASGTSGALSASAGAPRTPTIEDPTVTNPYSVPSGNEVDATVPDAAAAEERYGDVLSNVFGIYNGFTDLLHNMKLRTSRSNAIWRPKIEPALRRNSAASEQKRLAREKRLQQAARRNSRDLKTPSWLK